MEKLIVFWENSLNVAINFNLANKCDDSKLLIFIQWTKNEVLSTHLLAMLLVHAIDYNGNSQLPNLDFIQFGDWKKIDSKIE